MAKKKDTLKDLNEFMKNQSGLSDDANEDFLQKKPTLLADVTSLKYEINRLEELPEGALQEEEIAKLIQKIADSAGISNRQVLFRICEKVLNAQEKSQASDIMLLNMVTYLRHQDLILAELK